MKSLSPFPQDATVALRSRRNPASAPFRTGDVLSISRQHFHRIAYTEWGDPNSDRVVLCVHGLTRQGRDFDPLAAVLARQGYLVDMTMLIARLGVHEVDWVGTSLGGLIGMVMAGMADAPIRSLLINDIGP